MANPTHLAALSAGAASWNHWRTVPDASGRVPSNIDLSNADLTSYDLTGADLKGVNLRESDLTCMKLDRTELANADLTDAILEDADLSTVKGLLPSALAGADLTRAHLPDKLAKFEEMGRIDELSKNTGALFVSMMAACAYIGLTLGSTKDFELIPNSGTSKLPIIQTEIPIVAFYYIAPLILVGIFLYFHL